MRQTNIRGFHVGNVALQWVMGLVLFLSVVAMASGESLKSAARGDFTIRPYRYFLTGTVRDAINDYRDRVNQADIDVNRDRQMNAERERLSVLLESKGYYSAKITSSYDESKEKPNYLIRLGPRYKIRQIQLSGRFSPKTEQWRELEKGEALLSDSVLQQQAKLEEYISQNYCYFTQDVSHQVRLDHARAEADVSYVVNVEHPAVFGSVTFEGIGQINNRFLERTSGIKIDSCYQREAIDLAVISLIETGLFRQVTPKYRLKEGRVDVVFSMEKRKKRTISAGLGYKSQLGWSTSFGWQHRDLLGTAQQLSFDVELQRQLQSFKSTLQIPSFYDQGNLLSLTLGFENEQDEITSQQYSAALVLQRKASQRDYFEYGVGFQRIDEQVINKDWETYYQMRLPLTYRYDSIKNPFNPEGGRRFSVTLEPVLDIEDSLTPFVKSQLGNQIFIVGDNRLTWANRLQWSGLWYGSFLGSDADNIPRSELYKAGGSSSIRGYRYNSLKGTQLKNEEGGLHLWLLSNELRFQYTPEWGIVGFLDIGSVSDQPNPFNQPQWYRGYGAGVRYYTRFAPIRLDIAFPLLDVSNQRGFHLYVSLGQSF